MSAADGGIEAGHGRIDWAAIHLRLKKTRDSLERGSRQDVSAVLRERARKLARKREDDVDTGPVMRIVEFNVAKNRYAIDALAVREVFALRQLISLPRKLARTMGIVALRGEFVPLMDIRILMGGTPPGLSELNRVLVLLPSPGPLGILADEIVGMRAVNAGAIMPPWDSMPAGHAELTRGVIDGEVILLDAEKIFSAAAGRKDKPLGA